MRYYWFMEMNANTATARNHEGADMTTTKIASYEYYAADPTWNGTPRFWLIERITDGKGTWNGDAREVTQDELDDLRTAGYTVTLNDRT